MTQPLCFVAALGIGLLAWSPVACAQQDRVSAETGGVAVGGNVSNSNIAVGIPPAQLEALVATRTSELKERTEEQKKSIARLEKDLDLNERQIRAALEILGERNIPPERLAAKLVEIAERFKALKETASAQPGDDPKIETLKADAQKAIDAGELAKADALLAEIEAQQRLALDRLAVNAAATSSQRGQIALTRLQHGEAAKHFANAAAVFPPGGANEDKRIAYLEREADALYRQGDEFGDNGALISAIERQKRLADLRPRERVPLDWAMTQVNLGLALWTLGERESGTGRLDEAVLAYREALKEGTRERVPLQWAMTQMNLGTALRVLGERESGTGRLDEAVLAYREALKESPLSRIRSKPWCGADGRRSQRDHDLRAPARSCGQYSATGQCGTCLQ